MGTLVVQVCELYIFNGARLAFDPLNLDGSDSFAVTFPNERKNIKALGRRCPEVDRLADPDRSCLALTVYVLFILDAIETAFATYLAWTILVSGWGDPAAIVSLSWSSATIPLMTGISKSPGPPALPIRH